MYSIIKSESKKVGYAFFIIIIVAVIFIRCLVVYEDVIKFFTTGNDNGFKFKESYVLWKLAKFSKVQEPISLFISVPSLNNAISTLIADTRRRGVENTDKVQNFLTKLYKFRTELNLRHENNKGIESTKYLPKNQKLRIICEDTKGVFTSRILNNGYEIIINLPVQNNIATLHSDDWLNKNVSVYLWKKGDAAYVFDTHVTNAGVFNGQTALYLAQTNNLLRIQKRKSVRCECSLNADMYFINSANVDFNLVETERGFKVVLEDISEDGAMIRVGGKGVENAQIKLQFMLNDVLILMFGIVRAVEYNKEINQSRLHFECVHLEKEMRNAILSFVYNILPQNEQNIFDALNATQEDKETDEKLAGLNKEVEELQGIYKNIQENQGEPQINTEIQPQAQQIDTYLENDSNSTASNDNFIEPKIDL